MQTILRAIESGTLSHVQTIDHDRADRDALHRGAIAADPMYLVWMAVDRRRAAAGLFSTAERVSTA